MMIIYGAMYNWNVREENDELLSLHKTKEGAEAAIKKHKKLEYDNDREYCIGAGISYPHEIMLNRVWSVEEYELFD